MGLFDWLKKEQTNVEIDNDRIWMTKQAKLAGISSDIAESLADATGPFAVFLVAHFPDCLEELQALSDHAGFDQRSVLVTCAEALEGR